MKLKKIVVFFLFLLKTLQALEIELLNDENKVYEAGKLINLDFRIKNSEESSCKILLSVIDNEDFKPLFPNRSIDLSSNEERVVTLYVKIAPKKSAGKGEIPCLFELQNEKLEINYPILISKTTKVSLKNYYFSDKKVNLEIINESNHPIDIKGKKIAPYSNGIIPFTFYEEIIPGLYKGVLEVYDGKDPIQKFHIGSSTTKIESPQPHDEEFVFPINYGTAYSNNKSKNSLTFYTNGGGYFSENHSLNFNFSVPFFHKTDPYLYYNPEAAIFYLDYKCKDLNLRIGDSYFKNNPILFYTYGRGYSIGYSKINGVFGNFTYVTKNTFYPSQDKTLLISLGKNGTNSIFYHSNYDFFHYNQNLGFSYNPSSKIRGKIEAYNTDFKIDRSHLGFLGEFNLKLDRHSADFLLDYLGNHFYGRTNSEFKLLANYYLRSTDKNQGFFISGNYFNLFPESQIHNHTIGAKAGYNKIYKNSTHRLTLDYSNYHTTNLLRNNLSFYYSLNQKIYSSLFLQIDQGITYTTLSPNQYKEGVRSYTNFLTAYRKGGWKFSAGGKSQSRFFSDTLQPENAINLQAGYESNRTSVSTSLNFSNSTFKYKPSINFNLQTGYKTVDLHLDYQLIPTFSGFDYRCLFRLNFLNYLHLKKPVKAITHFYDINTKKLIDGLSVKTVQEKIVPISRGSATINLTHDELENLELSAYKIQRKKHRSNLINKIEDHFTFHVDFRGVVDGKIKFSSIRSRKSIEDLVLNQTITALDEDGVYHLGLIRSDGSFTINNLKQGSYKIILSSDDLPDTLKIQNLETTIDYLNPLQEVELNISY
jgi:hypothetical protein